MTQLTRNPAGATTSGTATRKGSISMYTNLNTQTKKTQGVKIAYLPNPNRLHFPLLGISRIDAQWIALFYLSAWDLLPGRYDTKKSKSANRLAITKLHKKFRAIAQKSGVKVARKIGVTQLLLSIQKIGVVNLLGYEKAESLLAALHYIYVGGVK